MVESTGFDVRDIVARLGKAQRIDRDRAIDAIKKAPAENFTSSTLTDFENAVLELMREDSKWEEKHGGLMATVTLFEMSDVNIPSAKFRSKLLPCLVRSTTATGLGTSSGLYLDHEYRVRESVAPVLEELAKIEGVSVYFMYK